MRLDHPWHKSGTQQGFSLVELLIVLTIISILFTFGINTNANINERAFFAQSKRELKNIASAVALYVDDQGEFPDDVNRSLPPGVENYLSPGEWPTAPWPDSVYDWDNWEDPDTGEPIYQVSIRFCSIGGGDCRFPDFDWAADFDVNSSVYYCIQGACRPHINEPVDHPGYCVNCNDSTLEEG